MQRDRQTMTLTNQQSGAVQIPAGTVTLEADLGWPTAANPVGLIIFAHGSGSGRRSPRNQFVARALEADGFATLLADLLTAKEEAADRASGRFRFDIDLLGRRVVALVDWARQQPRLRGLSIGLFGASTGAAAALAAATARPREIAAVVSRGGRPDLVGGLLPRVTAPTLLIVGGADTQVLEHNRWAKDRMRCSTSLEIVPCATHLFEEPGALEHVAWRAAGWFARHVRTPEAPSPVAVVAGTTHR
jgi:putative phosphoribosyl transferase